MSLTISTIPATILASGGGGGSGLLSIGILLLIPFAMYFFMIRPQRRRMKDQQKFQSSIGVDDDVITNSGIHGKITGEYDDETFWLEIDEDVQVRIARAAIQGKVPDGASGSDDESAADDSSGTDEPDDPAEIDPAESDSAESNSASDADGA